MKNGKNIRGALSYNEAKIRAGNAELILAARFGCDAAGLSFSQKLKRFSVLNDNCTRSGYNTVHISLNFSPGEKLDTEKMQAIAQDYMQQIGFEKQPYLVYRHNDAGHPHLHIVTTPEKPNGGTINLHNLVQRKSEPARKSIEETFQLIKAEGRKQSEGLKEIDLKAVQYGKAETKQSISQIVRTVADTYKFTSLEEYNLILQQFNVIADAGKPGTRMQKHGGLQYSLMNAKGEKVGVPIKASSIYTSPTLKRIEQKFAANQIKKIATLKYTASAVQFAITRSKNKKELMDRLEVKKIHLAYDRNKTWVFIDHRNKTVSSAEELGISPKLLESLEAGQYAELYPGGLNLSILTKLLEPEFNGPDLSPEFFKKKRKKKR
ncbi:MAG: relaxase/mobilization nuclease domain-containing protein [Sediminibacterium sp.]|nr:relaxase/mobilization nuclease domain-containing protein [Sediminibacterium sp.]